MAIALLCGMVLSGLMLLVLPMAWQLTGVMLAMPVSEWVAAVLAMACLAKIAKEGHKRPAAGVDGSRVDAR